MKNSPKSFTRHLNNRTILLILGLLLPVSAAASLCLGSVSIPPAQILRVFLGRSTPLYTSIVLLARLPRLCGCILAGAALAVSGTVIQSVLANPLAAPNIIGVNSGAGMAVAIFSALAPSYFSLIPVAAFFGALSAVLVVLLISERTGASRMTLVLSGIAVSGICSALIDAVLTFVPASLNGYTDFRIGGFSNLSIARLQPAVWMILVSFLLILSVSNELDVLALGSDVAASLGLHVRFYRIFLLTLAAALAGAAVSFSGLLGFVGLIVPHMMRRLVGENSIVLIPASALGGSVLVTLCDLAARILFAPYELPVGIVLSLIGGPFFIFLLIHQRGGRVHD